jgi:hypothetical protein
MISNHHWASVGSAAIQECCVPFGTFRTGHFLSWSCTLTPFPRSFLPLVQSVHHDDEIAERYGQAKARLAALGSMIPENELWSAANCLAHDLTLASRDAHFESVEGLRLARWE